MSQEGIAPFLLHEVEVDLLCIYAYGQRRNLALQAEARNVAGSRYETGGGAIFCF